MPRATLLLLACALQLACGPGEDGSGAPSMRGAAKSGVERARVLGPFLAAHWRLPVAPQGPPPAEWSEVEVSLQPASCGVCHPRQLAEWRTSLHASAFSPGFAGQLVEGLPPAEVRLCQTCHTPLAEQQAFDARLRPNPRLDPALRGQGVVCAACHVRGHRRFGPPRRPDAPPAPEPRPHGGFEVRVEYTEARFCATCHQFFDAPGVNGKPVQDTYAEWRASPQAARGRTCQGCHMPDRAHTWRGIHDPELVRQAVDVELVTSELAADALEAVLVLRSRDVGHAFPTYLTPRVFLALWQSDAQGGEIPDTRAEATLGREIDWSARPPREVFDTRVAPGESARLPYRLPRARTATTLVGRVTVDPDFHYRGVFEELRAAAPASSRGLLEEAHRRTTQSSYVLGEVRRPLPARPDG